MIFGWRVLLNHLSTKDQLLKRNIIHSARDILCVMCFEEEETLDHLFLHSLVSKNIWRGILVWLGMDEGSFANCIKAFNFYSDSPQKYLSMDNISMFWFIMWWSIWLGRNNILFCSFVVSIDDIVAYFKFLTWN